MFNSVNDGHAVTAYEARLLLFTCRKNYKKTVVFISV